MIPKEYKEKIAKSKGHWLERESNVKKFIDILNNHNKEIKGLKILDAGCAQGQDCKEFDRYGFNVTGLDCNKKFLTKAKEQNPKIKFELGDVENLPYKSESFDAVYCVNTLFYTNIQKSIPELIRVTKEKGIIFITLDIKITDLDQNKVIHKLNLFNALKYFSKLKILEIKYKERVDHEPFKHIHQFYDIVLIKR